jgi:hypothetical protein
MNEKELIKKLDSQVKLLSELKDEVSANVICDKIKELYGKVLIIPLSIKGELELRIKENLKATALKYVNGLRDTIEEPHAYLSDIVDVLDAAGDEDWAIRLRAAAFHGNYSDMNRYISEIYSDADEYCDALEEAINGEEEDE